MPGRPCFKTLGIPELTTKFDDLVKKGMPEYDAGMKVATGWYKELHKELNELKTSVGVKTDKYVPFDNSKEVKEINDKYAKLISEKQGSGAAVVEDKNDEDEVRTSMKQKGTNLPVYLRKNKDGTFTSVVYHNDHRGEPEKGWVEYGDGTSATKKDYEEYIPVIQKEAKRIFGELKAIEGSGAAVVSDKEVENLLQTSGIIKQSTNKAGNTFFTVKRSAKWFADINKFFSDKYGIDAPIYNYQNKKSKKADDNGYYTLPDGTRMKESPDGKGGSVYYIQSPKFNQRVEVVSDKEVQGKAETKNRKDLFKDTHGVSFDEVNNAVEDLASKGTGSYLNVLEVALGKLGIKSDFRDKVAYTDFVKIKLEEDLPKKLPNKKDKYDADPQDFNGNIDVKPIEQKIKLAEKSPKGREASLGKYVSKDDLRPVMMGVFHDAENKAFVITDAHKLVWIEDASIKETKIVDPKTGKIIEGNFPRYKDVIPTDNPIKVNGLSAQDLINQSAGLDRANKFINGSEILAIINIGDRQFAFDPKLFNEVITAMAENGAKTINVELSTPTRAMVLSTPDNKNVHGLLMPKMFGEEGFLNPHKVIFARELTLQEKKDGVQSEINSLERTLKDRKKELSQAVSDFRKAKAKDARSSEWEMEYQQKKVAEIEKQIDEKNTDLANLDNPLEEQDNLQTVKENIDNGNITEEQAVEHLSKTNEQLSKSEPVVKDIESKAESDNEVELNEAIQQADELISEPTKEQEDAVSDTTPMPKEPDAGKQEKEIPAFHKKVDAAAEALIKALSAKLPPGTKKLGEGNLADIIHAAADIIKKAHTAGTNIKDAIEEAITYVKKYFADRDLAVDEAVIRDYFESVAPHGTQTTATGSPPPPTGASTAGQAADGEVIGISHERLNVAAAEMGLPPYEKSPETMAEWNTEADRRIANGEMPALIEKMEQEGAGIPTAPEQIMLLKYLGGLKADYNATRSDAIFQEFKRVRELSDVIAGRLWGQSGRARQSEIPVHSLEGGLLHSLTTKAEALGVDVLTDKQKAEVEEQVKLYEERTEAAEAKVAELEAKMAEMEAKKKLASDVVKAKSAAKGKKKSADDYKKERASLKQELEDAKKEHEQWLKDKGINKQGFGGFTLTPKMVKIIGKIISSHVDEVGNNLADVTKRVLDEIKDLFPDVETKDVHDIIAGVYNQPKPALSDLQTDLRNLKQEARMLNELIAVESGVPKTEKQIIEKNQKLKELRDKLKEAKAEAGYDDKTKLQAIKSRNETQTKNINERIAKKDFAPAKKPLSIFDNKELQKKYPALYKETLDAIKAREDAKHDFDIAVLRDQQSRMKGKEKAVDILSKISGTVKAIVTGIDDSAVAIQTYMATIVRPVIGGRSLKIHAEQAFSQKKFDRWLTELHNSEDWDLIQKSGLSVTEPMSLKEAQKEEVFNNRFSGTIKVKGKEYKLIDALLKPFERAFTSLGNATRVLAFRQIAGKYMAEGNTFENNPELFKSLATRLNTETGRGKENEYIAQASKIVTLGIWSPKLMSSKFNILGISDLASIVLSRVGTKGYYSQLHPRERMAAIKDVAQYAATVTALSFLAALAFGGDVDDDPLSSTFMDIKLPNGKSFNLTGGFSSYIRHIFQFVRGQKSRDGEVKDASRLNTLGRFFRGKTPPIMSATLSSLEGKDFMGRPTSPLKEAANVLIPISVKGISEQIARDGATSLFTQGIPTFFGFNVKDEADYLSQPGATITIKNPKTFKERQITPEEHKKYKATIAKDVPLLLKKFTSNVNTIWVDINGKVHLSKEGGNITNKEKKTWKPIKHNKLSEEQKKDLEDKIKDKVSRVAEKSIKF